MEEYDQVRFMAPKFHTLYYRIFQGQSYSQKEEYVRRKCRKSLWYFMTSLWTWGGGASPQIHARQMRSGSRNSTQTLAYYPSQTHPAWLSGSKGKWWPLVKRKSMIYVGSQMKTWETFRLMGASRPAGCEDIVPKKEGLLGGDKKKYIHEWLNLRGPDWVEYHF